VAVEQHRNRRLTK